MSTRREVVLGGLLTIAFGAGSCCAFAQPARRGRGCLLSPEEANALIDDRTDTRLFLTGKEPMIPGSGDADFDSALSQTLAKISTTFGVSPGFAYFEEPEGEGSNAYATNEVRLKKSDGTVLFGKRLLGELLGLPENPEVAIAAVCAHEFGHILQYKRGLDRIVMKGQSTVKRGELQADFFAGYFAGARKLERPSFPAAVFALTQFNFGDESFDDPGHHGTPEERGAAISRGFDVAFRERRTFAEAIDIGTGYVQSL